MTTAKPLVPFRCRLIVSTALAGGLAGIASPAAAQLPSGPTVVAGATTFRVDGTSTAPGGVDGTGTRLDVDLNGVNGIVNWNSFNIGTGPPNVVSFNAGGAGNLAILNRVIGGGTSTIGGQMLSDPNVSVFLINPNGILFGPSANVNVGSLIASTLDIADADFLDGSPYSLSGTGTMGVTIDGGASLVAGGELILLGGFFNVGASSTLSAGGNVAFVAGSDITMSFGAGSPMAITIAQGTPVDGVVIPGQLTVGGTVTGQNVYVAAATRSTIMDALLNVSGSLTATTASVTDRGVVLAAGAPAAGVAIDPSGDTTGGVSVQIGGAITAQVDPSAPAGTIASVEIRARNSVGATAPITAAHDVAVSSDQSTVSVGGVTADRDLAIRANGDLTAGTLSAGDDIVLEAAGALATLDITSGTGTDETGVGDAEAGIPLAGADVRIATAGALDPATEGVLVGRVRANGAGSDIRISGGTNGTGDGTTDLDLIAGGNVEIIGGARGVDVAISGGGSVSTGSLQARDDIAVRAVATVSTGDLASGTTVGSGLPVESAGAADALLPSIDFSGHDIDVAGDGVMLGRVVANGAGSDVRIAGGTAGIGNSTTDVDIDAAGDVTLQGDAVGRDVALRAGGTIVTGQIAGADDIVLRIGGNGTTGSLTSGTGPDVAGAGDALAAATLAGGDIDIVGGNGVLFGRTVATGASSDIRVDSGAGGIGSGAQDIDLDAGGAITLSDPARGRDIAIRAGASVDTASLSARDDIAIRAATMATAGALTSGTTVDASSPIDVAGAADTLLPATDLSGHDIDIAAAGIALLGPVRANGAGSDVRINGGAPGTGTLGDDLDLGSGGAIDITGAARGRDIALNAGTTLTVASLTAADDIAVRAVGAFRGGALTSGTDDVAGAADALLPAVDWTGSDIDVAANGIELGGPARANGAQSDIRLSGGAAGVGVVGSDLDLGAGRNVEVSGTATGRDVAISAGGQIETDAVTAADDIVMRAADDVSTGTLTSGTGAEAPGAADTLASPTGLAGADIDLAGNGVVIDGLGRANGVGSDIRISGGVTGTGNLGITLDLAAGADIVLAGAARGDDILLDAAGNLTVDALTAVDDASLRAGGVLTMNASAAIGDDMSLRATDFAGVALSTPFAAGSGDDLTIIDTAGGLVMPSALTVPGTLSVRVESGSLVVDGALASTNEDIALETTGGGNITLNGGLTTPTTAGRSVTLTSAGALTQTAGAITTDWLSGSAAGSVALVSNTNAITRLGGFSSSTGSFELRDTNGLTVDGAVSAPLGVTIRTTIDNLTVANTGSIQTAGPINLFAGGSVALDGNVASSGGGTIDIEADTGNITFAADVTTTGNMDLDAGGSITQSAGRIQAATLTGVAGGATSLMSSGNLATNLGAFTADGFALNDSAGGLTIIGPVGGGGGGVSVATTGDLTVNAAVTAADAPITLSASSNLDLNAPVDAGTGTVSLTATSGAISQAAAGTITAGTLTGLAGGNATLNAANAIGTLGSFSANGFLLHDSGGGLAVTGPVNAGTGTLGLRVESGPLTLAGDLTAAGTVTLEAIAGAIDQTGGRIAAATFTGQSDGGASLNSATNAVSTLAGFTNSGAGGFSFVDSVDLTVTANVNAGTDALTIDTTGTLTLAANLLSGSGATLRGNGVAQDAPTRTVDAGSGPILVDGNDGAVSLPGSLLTTNGTATAVRIVDSGSATIGNITTGSGGTVTLGGPVDDAINGTLVQTVGSAISTGTLAGNVTGSATLENAGNQIAVLGAFDANGFALRDAADGLTVSGPVQAGSGDLLLRIDSGPLALARNLASAGTVTLDVVNGAITQTGGGIQAATLTGQSVGGASLNSATNAVSTLAGFTNSGAGGFSFVDGVALAVTAPVNAGSDALSIQVNGAPLGLAASLTSGNGAILRGTGITQNAGTTVNAGSGTILVDGDDGAINLAGSLITTDGGANAVRIIDSGNAVLGNISPSAGATVTLGGAGDDALGGTVGQTAGTAISAATLVGNATGAVTLENDGNQIDVLGAFAANGFALRDAGGGLTVTGPVDAGSGDLRLRTDAGPLALEGNLTAAGTVTLQAIAGTINQSAGRISAGTLTGQSVGGTTLDSATNAIGTVAGFTNSGGGGFSLVDSIALAVTGNVGAGTGNLSIDAPGINFAGRTLTAGTNVTLEARSGALTGGTVTAGGSFTGRGGSVAIDSATATAGALSLTATSGQLSLGTGTAGTTATLIKEGASGELQVATLLNAGGNVAIGSAAAPARLGTVISQSGDVAMTAADLDVNGAIAVSAARQVTLSNSGAGPTRLGGATGAAGAFSLTHAEMDRISAGTLTVRSMGDARDIQIGELSFENATGSNRVNLLTAGRIDVTGAVSTNQTGHARRLLFGGSAPEPANGCAANSDCASVIAVDSSAGGRLLMGNSQLSLRSRHVGVGQADFLDEIGLNPGATPLDSDRIATFYVGNAVSRLYVPLNATGADVVTAYSLDVSYSDFALFQNTAAAQTPPRGALIGAGGVNSTLVLRSSGETAPNAFALFGRVNDREGSEAALVGPDVIQLSEVNRNNSRINGCLIGSSAGCLVSVVSTPRINVFDATQASLLRAGNELTLSFDPLIGSNNEALFGGLATADPQLSDPDCENNPDDPRCQQERNQP
ncbi:MAG TPA: filamentous hemagglutinin N-terminal domain-containing protein [Allosphingosinicella sp.]|nr:filamentous hemagglutinin N-terminal domain-containing protein [Allosphingosinicella sp.]